MGTQCSWHHYGSKKREIYSPANPCNLLKLTKKHKKVNCTSSMQSTIMKAHLDEIKGKQENKGEKHGHQTPWSHPGWNKKSYNVYVTCLLKILPWLNTNDQSPNSLAWSWKPPRPWEPWSPSQGSRLQKFLEDINSRQCSTLCAPDVASFIHFSPTSAQEAQPL